MIANKCFSTLFLKKSSRNRNSAALLGNHFQGLNIFIVRSNMSSIRPNSSLSTNGAFQYTFQHRFQYHFSNMQLAIDSFWLPSSRLREHKFCISLLLNFLTCWTSTHVFWSECEPEHSMMLLGTLSWVKFSFLFLTQDA